METCASPGLHEYTNARCNIYTELDLRLITINASLLFVSSPPSFPNVPPSDNSAMVDLKEEGFVGSVDVKFEAPGVRYFICQIPGHCSANQKLRVTVTESSVKKPGPVKNPP